MQCGMLDGLQAVVTSFKFHQNRLSDMGGQNLPSLKSLAVGLYNSFYYCTGHNE